MKIAFHCNQLSLRGTEVAMYDYAHYNEKLLGNKSIILAKNPAVWKYSDQPAIDKFKNRFEVFFYNDIREIEEILDDNKVDVFYAQKAGDRDGVVSNNRKTVIHTVFQQYDPHGDVYAFISEWLSRIYCNVHDFVPYMVDLPDHDKDMREELGIPADAIVFGRHGGYETFDIPFVKHCVGDVVSKRNDVWFLFMNTEKFVDHPRVLFLEPTADLKKKTEFINTCNAMIHARFKGETFGLACAEFSLRNKPVITFAGSMDRAHEMILKDKGFYYRTIGDLQNIFSNMDRFFKGDNLKRDWNQYRDYSPEKVMTKFKKVFLDGN
jgi:hypothetical protein